MLRTTLALLILGSLALTTVRADNTNANALQFPEAGFSIKPLEPAAEASPRQALLMSLATDAGFSANVTVVIQPFRGTLDDYAAQMENQFKEDRYRVLVRKRVGGSGVIFEYAGEYHNMILHWYTRTEIIGGRAYLVTATALERGWAEQGKTLKDCVDSFHVDNPPK